MSLESVRIHQFNFSMTDFRIAISSRIQSASKHFSQTADHHKLRSALPEVIAIAWALLLH
jgi:hypothetical protein